MEDENVFYFNMTAGGESLVAREKGPDEWTVFERIMETFDFIK
jgi:hypothetical protein